MDRRDFGDTVFMLSEEYKADSESRKKYLRKKGRRTDLKTEFDTEKDYDVLSVGDGESGELFSGRYRPWHPGGPAFARRVAAATSIQWRSDAGTAGKKNRAPVTPKAAPQCHS